MIRVPETAAVLPGNTPFPFEPAARGVIELSLVASQHFGIGAAGRAHTAVPLKYLFPQITWIGAQLPFVHARIRAESKAALRCLLPAPPAEVASMRAFRQPAAVYPAAFLGSPGTLTLNFKQG
jgi:hypothetical protein